MVMPRAVPRGGAEFPDEVVEHVARQLKAPGLPECAWRLNLALNTVKRYARGLYPDKEAMHAAVTPPYHNGGTEGVNTKTKQIMRQMHGRASFALVRHHILLGLHNALSPPKVRQSR